MRAYGAGQERSIVQDVADSVGQIGKADSVGGFENRIGVDGELDLFNQAADGLPGGGDEVIGDGDAVGQGDCKRDGVAGIGNIGGNPVGMAVKEQTFAGGRCV